jgi:rhamnulokinase
VKVIAAAGHDTACAVAAISLDYIYLSSATWSLMGIESPQPIINQESLAYNLTNEGGVNGTFRVLKNIIDMCLLQECRREWALQGQSYSYAELTQMAAEAPPLQSFVRPSDPRFLHSGDAQSGKMVARIQAFCLEMGQNDARSIGEVTRCILESLALEYRRTVEQLDSITAKELPAIGFSGMMHGYLVFEKKWKSTRTVSYMAKYHDWESSKGTHRSVSIQHSLTLVHCPPLQGDIEQGTPHRCRDKPIQAI